MPPVPEPSHASALASERGQIKIIRRLGAAVINGAQRYYPDLVAVRERCFAVRPTTTLGARLARRIGGWVTTWPLKHRAAEHLWV